MTSLGGYGTSLPGDALEILFDAAYYESQTGRAFATREAALSHFLVKGAGQGRDPNRLFDTTFYLAQAPELDTSRANALAHFLAVGAFERRDPSPYFDVEFYFAQAPGLRENGINPLVHYLEHARDQCACNPNPLFAPGFYTALYEEVGGCQETPFEHYLRAGWRAGRWASEVHQRMLENLADSLARPLLRGGRARPVVLFLVGTSSTGSVALAAQDVAADYGLDALAVFLARPDTVLQGRAHTAVLHDHLDEETHRPSAIRLLAKSLSATQPHLAVTDVPDAIPPLCAAGVRTYAIIAPDAADESSAWLASADRLIFMSNAPFARATAHRFPTRVAVRPYRATNVASRATCAESYARDLFELARRDSVHGRTPVAKAAFRTPFATRRVVVPCADWAVSGVNTALEEIGQELIHRGWDLEVLFTRDQESVVKSADGVDNLPRVPFGFLGQEYSGVEGMWGALIEALEGDAPCVVLMAYDFIANSVVSALPNNIGTVMWTQADDGDYYSKRIALVDTATRSCASPSESATVSVNSTRQCEIGRR